MTKMSRIIAHVGIGEKGKHVVQQLQVTIYPVRLEVGHSKVLRDCLQQLHPALQCVSEPFKVEHLLAQMSLDREARKSCSSWQL